MMISEHSSPTFFENLINTLIKKIICIRAFFRMNFAICDHVVYILENMKRVCVIIILLNQRFKEAAAAASVASCSDLIDFSEDCIYCRSPAQVILHTEVTGSKTLEPEFLTTAAPVKSFYQFFSRFLEGLFIHICYHKYLAFL